MQRLLLLFVLFVAGCAPEIGDPCDTSTDCSQNGDRLCDVSQQGGYCTVFDCEKGKCPEEAACILFSASPSTVPECKNETGTSPSQRSFCMLKCEKDSDCRPAEGYACLPASGAGGENLDDGARSICMHKPVAAPVTDRPGDVCIAETPSEGTGGAGGAAADD